MVGQGFEFLLPEGLAAHPHLPLDQAASQQSQHDLPPEAATVGRVCHTRLEPQTSRPQTSGRRCVRLGAGARVPDLRRRLEAPYCRGRAAARAAAGGMPPTQGSNPKRTGSNPGVTSLPPRAPTPNHKARTPGEQATQLCYSRVRASPWTATAFAGDRDAAGRHALASGVAAAAEAAGPAAAARRGDSGRGVGGADATAAGPHAAAGDDGPQAA
eukprot:scaffold16184_cov71-Phaeocystis_antarctica.AAC.7